MLLVATHWRTNLNLRQVAPLCGLLKSAADRILDHLAPLLAISPAHRPRKDTVYIVNGTLVPTRDLSVAASSMNYRYSTNLQVVISPTTDWWWPSVSRCPAAATTAAPSRSPASTGPAGAPRPSPTAPTWRLSKSAKNGLPRGAVTPPRELDRPMAGRAVEFVGMITPRLAHRMARAAVRTSCPPGGRERCSSPPRTWSTSVWLAPFSRAARRGGVVLHADRATGADGECHPPPRLRGPPWPEFRHDVGLRLMSDFGPHRPPLERVSVTKLLTIMFR